MIPTPVRSEGGLLLIKPPSVSLSVRRTVKSRDLLSLSRVKGGEKLKRERDWWLRTQKRGTERCGERTGAGGLLVAVPAVQIETNYSDTSVTFTQSKKKRRGEDHRDNKFNPLLSRVQSSQKNPGNPGARVIGPLSVRTTGSFRG